MSFEIQTPVTSKDIARELNLSQATVSRILNGVSNHRASEDTRLRVFEAAQRLGYRPNAIARSLRSGRTNIVGFHLSHTAVDVRNEFLGSIVGALQCACDAFHLDLMLHSSRGTSPEAMFGRLRDGRLDGIILFAPSDDDLVSLLSGSSLPMVAVADSLPGIDTVTCDDASGMQQLIEALWGRGHRNFVFLAPHISYASVQRRQQVFEQELKRRGLPANARRVITIHYEDASSALEELLVDTPVAVCTWNDRTAYALLRACKLAGVKVPSDVAVTGFDGFRDDQFPARELMTVRCPWDEVAATALRRLVHLIELRQAKQAPPAPQEIILPVTLLDGDTA